MSLLDEARDAYAFPVGGGFQSTDPASLRFSVQIRVEVRDALVKLADAAEGIEVCVDYESRIETNRFYAALERLRGG